MEPGWMDESTREIMMGLNFAEMRNGEEVLDCARHDCHEHDERTSEP